MSLEKFKNINVEALSCFNLLNPLALYTKKFAVYRQNDQDFAINSFITEAIETLTLLQLKL